VSQLSRETVEHAPTQLPKQIQHGVVNVTIQTKFHWHTSELAAIVTLSTRI